MLIATQVNIESHSELIDEPDEASKDEDEGGIYMKKHISSKKWEWSYFRVSVLNVKIVKIIFLMMKLITRNNSLVERMRDTRSRSILSNLYSQNAEKLSLYNYRRSSFNNYLSHYFVDDQSKHERSKLSYFFL